MRRDRRDVGVDIRDKPRPAFRALGVALPDRDLDGDLRAGPRGVDGEDDLALVEAQGARLDRGVPACVEKFLCGCVGAGALWELLALLVGEMDLCREVRWQRGCDVCREFCLLGQVFGGLSHGLGGCEGVGGVGHCGLPVRCGVVGRLYAGPFLAAAVTKPGKLVSC